MSPQFEVSTSSAEDGQSSGYRAATDDVWVGEFDGELVGLFVDDIRALHPHEAPDRYPLMVHIASVQKLVHSEGYRTIDPDPETDPEKILVSLNGAFAPRTMEIDGITEEVSSATMRGIDFSFGTKPPHCFVIIRRAAQQKAEIVITTR